MNINLTVKTFNFTAEDGKVITYERICVNGMPLKPMYEKDKAAYRYLIELIKLGKEEY